MFISTELSQADIARTSQIELLTHPLYSPATEYFPLSGKGHIERIITTQHLPHRSPSNRIKMNIEFKILWENFL